MIYIVLRLLTVSLLLAVFSGIDSASADDRFLHMQIPQWTESQSGDEYNERADHSPAFEQDDDQPRRQKNASSLPLPMTPNDYKAILAQIAPVQDHAGPAVRLEEHYSNRVSDDLRQFGYNFLQKPAPSPASATAIPAKDSEESLRNIPTGAVQDSFILNIGDRLNVILRGQRNHQSVYSISSDGLLIIQDMPPIPAAGRSIGQIRAELEHAAGDLHNTDIFLSLESVRQVGVLIVGHVHQPGRQNLTVFHTVLDALIQAGGIKKTGSLRQVKLIRDGRSQMIDLYELLNHGSTGTEITLRDGDRLVVPTIGPTIAIGGDVKRPGIYEILPVLKGMRHDPSGNSEKLSLQQALDLGGGLLSPGNNRFIKLTMATDGREIVTDLSDPFTPTLGDGSILMVSRATEKRSETVSLAGHTRQPGIHALSRAGTLSALLPDAKIFGPDIYPLLGIVERMDKTTLSKQFLDFPPQLVAAGHYDRKLQDGDKVLLFSRQEILDLQKPVKSKKDLSGLESLTTHESVFSDDPALKAFLMDHAVSVRGAVRDNGLWPVAEGTTLNVVIAAAGGFSLDANPANIELTINAENSDTPRRRSVNYDEDDPETIAIPPGSAIRVNQKFRKTVGQTVTIIGEIEHPGKYDLLPGDTLGKLIARAGMLTAEAYPEGAIFSRDSLRKAEEARFRAAAQELERAVAAATEKAKDPPDPAQIAMAHDLASELRNVTAIGRITVEADPAILKTRPELDILLEPNDRIYIPRRPLTVRVHGEVLSPATLQFRSTKTPSTYISEAGGMTYYADSGRTFVLYPDGSAQPLQVSAWNHKAVMIPPGSTIVVPRDPKPFNFMETAKDFSQILANLAITGIFLHDLNSE